MLSHLLCEWNLRSDDRQHEGHERCTDCLVSGLRPGLADECIGERQEDAHCPTCECHEVTARHDEGFMSCDDHLDALMGRYKIAPARDSS